MDKKQKLTKNKINLSESFMVRTRCKHCTGVPEIYFKLNGTKLFIDPNFMKKKFNSIRDYTKWIKSNFYLIEDPKSFNNVNHLSYQHLFKSFNCGLSKSFSKDKKVTECLLCACGKTMWEFRNRELENRPDISHRKARNTYPKIFIY